MVQLIDVPPALTQAMTDEVTPLLGALGPYSLVNEDPRILLLRNPGLPAAHYDAWAKDYRFGRNTCPTAQSPAWMKGGTIARAVALAAAGAPDSDPALVPVSAMVIAFLSKKQAGVGYHKDPNAYTKIVSFTMTGSGELWVRHGNRRGVAYDLVPGKAVVMEEADCCEAKHSVKSNGRLGLVVRFVHSNNFSM